MTDKSEAGSAAYKAAAKPWRRAGAAFLIPGMALVFCVTFLMDGRAPLLSMIGGILMMIGLVITLIGFSKGEKAKKAVTGS